MKVRMIYEDPIQFRTLAKAQKNSLNSLGSALDNSVSKLPKSVEIK